MAVGTDAEAEIFFEKVVVLEGRYEALTARRTQHRRLGKQVALLAALVALVLSFWYVGVIGGGLVVAAEIAAIYMDKIKIDRKRGARLNQVVDTACTIVRLQLIAEAEAAGQSVWRVELSDPKAKPLVATEGNEAWTFYWRRVYELSKKHGRLSSRQRAVELRRAINIARPALAAGERLAKAVDGEIIFWARDAAGAISA